MMSMCDIIDMLDQGQTEILKNLSFKEKITEMYKNELDQLHSDFYNVLWQNNPQTYKFPKDMKEISELFSDGHPTPIEHLEYLQNIFPNTFSEKTSDAVKEKYSFFIQNMKRLALHYNRTFTVYELNDYENNLLRKGTILVESEEIKFI